MEQQISQQRSWQTPAEVKENLKEYFSFLYKANNDRKEFPVSLDLVWPLAYSRKDPAVRELKQTFMQDIDYKVFHKNVENLSGGRPTEEYFITTSCFEYLIARKVREVFEVYRTVFHQFFEEVTGEKQEEPKVATYELPKIPTEVTFVCDPQRALFITANSAYTDFNRYFDMMWSREMCGCRFPIDLAEVYTLRYKKYDAATNHINKKKCCSFLRYREGIDYIKIRPDGDKCVHYMMTPETFYDIFCDYNDNLAASYINHYGQRRVPMRSRRAYELPRKNSIQRAILAGKMDALDAEQILCIRRFHEDCPNVDDPQLKDLPIYRAMVNDIVRWLNSNGKILDPEMYTEILEAEEEAKAVKAAGAAMATEAAGKTAATGAAEDAGAAMATEAAGKTAATGATGAAEDAVAAGAAGATEAAACQPVPVLGDSIAEPSRPAALAAPAVPASPVAAATDDAAIRLSIKVDEAAKVLPLMEIIAACHRHMVIDIDMRSNP